MTGDLTNLVGCILSSQLPTMKGVASIYVTLSTTMFTQYVYYKYFKCAEEKPLTPIPEVLRFSPSMARVPYISPRFQPGSQRNENLNLLQAKRPKNNTKDRVNRARTASTGQRLYVIMVPFVMYLLIGISNQLMNRSGVSNNTSTVSTVQDTDFIGIGNLRISQTMQNEKFISTTGRVLWDISPALEDEDVLCGVTKDENPLWSSVGLIFSWIMVAAYCTSRTPQIYMNYGIYFSSHNILKSTDLP